MSVSITPNLAFFAASAIPLFLLSIYVRNGTVHVRFVQAFSPLEGISGMQHCRGHFSKIGIPEGYINRNIMDVAGCTWVR